MVAAGNASPRLAGLFSSFTANDPQLTVEIDRERALALGVPLSEVTSALQIFLGSQYVNDFDFNNRAYRVYVQADKAFRADPAALGKLYVRNREGQMLPLQNVVRTKEATAPQVISHFNLFRSATLNGSAAPGFSSGQALEEMERVAKQTLPAGMSYAWSGLSFEENKAGQQSFVIFGLGLLLVYLTLAAQAESPCSRSSSCWGAACRVRRRRGSLRIRQRRTRRWVSRPHRPGGQERHPDRGVRGTAESAGAVVEAAIEASAPILMTPWRSSGAAARGRQRRAARRATRWARGVGRHAASTFP